MSLARILCAISLCALISCVDSSKPSAINGVSTLSVKLLDSGPKIPGIKSVEVEIENIQISYDGEFVTVYEGPMVYDLYGDKGESLNEVAFVPVREGVVNQVRVVIGQARAIGEDGIVYDVKAPSAESSGVKAPIAPAMNIIPGGVEFEIEIDFELAKNLAPHGGGFLFTPVIQVYNRTYRKHLYGKLMSDSCSPGPDDDRYLSGQTLNLVKNGEVIKTVETYENGRFLFVGLRPGEYLLDASAPSHQDAELEVRVQGADTQLTVRLSGKCASIKGSVFSEDGSAIVDATVMLFDRDGALVDEVLSFSDGSFRTFRHFEGDYLLTVEALGHAPQTIELYDEDIYTPLSIVLEEEL